MADGELSNNKNGFEVLRSIYTKITGGESVNFGKIKDNESVFKIFDRNNDGKVSGYESALFTRGFNYIRAKYDVDKMTEEHYGQVTKDLTDWLNDLDNVFGLDDGKIPNYFADKSPDFYGLDNKINVNGREFINISEHPYEKTDEKGNKIFKKDFIDPENGKKISVKTVIGPDKSIKREITEKEVDASDEERTRARKIIEENVNKDKGGNV